MRLESLLAGLAAANGHGGISIPGNENLRPETFGRTGLQLAPETADWRLQTEFPRAKPRKSRAILDTRKLRQFGATGWWRTQSGETGLRRAARPFAAIRFFGRACVQSSYSGERLKREFDQPLSDDTPMEGVARRPANRLQTGCKPAANRCKECEAPQRNEHPTTF